MSHLQEIEALRAEVERLRAENHDLVDSVQTWSEVSARVCAEVGADVLTRIPERFEELRLQIADLGGYR